MSEATYQSLEEMILGVAEMVRPPERLTVSEAAAKYRKLNNPGSYVGMWPNEKTPYLVEPMDVLTSLDFTAEIFVGPARTGKSDMFLNWQTHTAKCDPTDMMLVHMTQATARDYSIGDLAKLFRHSEDVKETLVPGRQNDNVFDKRFKSGARTLIKWPTITELSGKTIARNWLMDYDRMPDDVDGEGTPFDLTRKRAETFRRFGMTVAESSPGREIENPKLIGKTPHEAPATKGILELYNRGDRRRWYWGCLSCRHKFEADFKHLNYPDSEDRLEASEMVTLRCPKCGFDMDPSMKAELNRNGRWIKDGQLWLPDGSIVGTPVRSDIASFWLKGPAAAFQDWQKLVYKYLQAMDTYLLTGDTGPLKTTINTDQGLPFTPPRLQGDRLPEDLKSRAVDIGDRVVPNGVRFLVASIDVQKNRFVVQVHGFSPNNEISIIDRFEIKYSQREDAEAPGQKLWVNPAAYLEDWKLLISEVIEKTYSLADGSGRRMSIKMVGCDSGGAEGVTSKAYDFWRFLKDDHDSQHHRRFQLLKGVPNLAAPRVRISYPDAERTDRRAGARGEVPVLQINSNAIKDQVSAILDRTDPGGARVTFPDWLPDSFFTELTVEVRNVKGIWENLKRQRNESWDLLCYALAIALSRAIKIELLDWSEENTELPSWAKDWDENDLVGSGTDAPFATAQKNPRRSLADLGRDLT